MENVLWGYEAQTEHCFEVIIADDGSTKKTEDLIESLRPQLSYPIKHAWHADHGFQKCKILNKALLSVSANYVLFSDGDCIPRWDFVAIHLTSRRKGRFLSGGYHKLPMPLSKKIKKDDILSNRCFHLKWLRERGMKSSLLCGMQMFEVTGQYCLLQLRWIAIPANQQLHYEHYTKQYSLDSKYEF